MQVRHRRSERHRQSEKSVQAPAPQGRRAAGDEAPRETQWERRQVSSWPEEGDSRNAAYTGRRGNSAQDELYMRRSAPDMEAEDDFEDEERRLPWGKIIAAAAVVLVLLTVVLMVVQDAGPLNPVKNVIQSLLPVKQKAPGEVLSFQCASNTAATGTRMLFNLTTNQSVDGVRIEDAEGNEIACTATLVNGANETNKIWNINAIFDSPYAGDIFAAIREGENWKRTDKSVVITVSEPTPAPTETPEPVAEPVETVVALLPTDEPVIPQETASLSSVVTWAPTNAPVITEIPTPEPTPEPTEAPTPEPTETPEPTATPGPTMAPTATPLPRLEATAGAGSLKSTDTVYQGKKSITFNRAQGLVATHPDQYAYYPMGVVTFRGDNFRRNAAYGTAKVETAQLSVLWKTPLGFLRTEDNGTLYGVGWTGQPAIVKWTTQVREMMNLYEEKKNTKALIEVIFGGQDGKIYFLDLKDGTATRDTINVGFPLKGSVSVDSWDRPLLAVGQGISKLPNKTGSIGLHLFNLIDGKEAYFLNGRKNDSQVQYSTNGAFDGTALFLFNNQGTDVMIAAGENGLLYTVDLNGKFVYPNVENPDAQGSMEIKPSVTYLRTKSGDEKDGLVNVEGSVAMYDRYIYMADTYGVIRCVNSDTMTTVWAVDGGDNTDASIALDMEGDTVALYTGNTAYSRLGSKKDVTIRRLDALTGQEIWQYQIKCDYDKNQVSGCKASPVIGQNGLKDLVIFTVNKVNGGGSRILALNKQSGQVVWEKALDSEAVSSPVAVYNEEGRGWIIQGDQGGNLTMLDGLTGAVKSTLNLGGAIEGSPAVYKNYLVVGTCSKDNACMYGIQIQ